MIYRKCNLNFTIYYNKCSSFKTQYPYIVCGYILFHTRAYWRLSHLLGSRGAALLAPYDDAKDKVDDKLHEMKGEIKNEKRHLEEEAEENKDK